MPALPDKFALSAHLPQNTRSIASIKDESPLYAAGQGFGNAIAGFGQALRLKEEKKEKEKEPAEDARAISEAVRLIQTADRDFKASPDPGQAGINAADYLEQSKTSLLGKLSPQAQVRVGQTIEALFKGQGALIGEQIEPRKRDLRIAGVEALFPQMTVQHASVSDPVARQEIGTALFGSIEQLLANGDIDEARAQAMKQELQRQLVRADVQAQPAQWQMTNLQPGPGGKGNWFIDTLGEEDAAYLRAQAVQRGKAEERDSITQSLLDRYGTALENEPRALAEIQDKHSDDPGLQRLYLGRLQIERRQERRDLAQSAFNAYQLAVNGRANEIDPADRKRLHVAKQLDELLDAAQYGGSADFKGELLFKERFLAMGEEERARYGVADLAKRLSPQDFLEVTQGASDGLDEGQRTRMQGFVQAVTPMLRSVTIGEYAELQEQERDRGLLGLVREEANMLVADEEKKIGRSLTAIEYHSVMRRASDLALLHSVGLESDVSDNVLRSTSIWKADLNGRSDSSPTSPAEFNVAALDETDVSSGFEPQAYSTNAARTDDPEADGNSNQLGTLLAQGSGRPGGGGSGNRPTRLGGPFGRSGAPELETILRRYETRIQQLEPNNPNLPSIRDPNIPPSNQHLRSMELELNAAAFRFSNNMAFGHGYRKHAHEFYYPITRSDYASIAQRVLTDPRTQSRELEPQTFVYHSRSENVVVVVDHRSPDGGSMYPVPPGRAGVRYFERMSKDNLRK